MAKPVKLAANALKEAVEQAMRDNGAQDWVVIARGNNQAIFAGYQGAVKAAFWEGGSGNPDEIPMDELRLELLLVDLRKIQRSIENYLDR